MKLCSKRSALRLNRKLRFTSTAVAKSEGSNRTADSGSGFTEDGTTPLAAAARAMTGDVPAAVSTAAPLTN